MEIVVLDAFSFNPGDIDWEPIARYGHLTIYDDTAREQLAGRLKDADAAFTNRLRFGEAEFAAAPKLRFLGLFATGYNNIDMAAARRHDVAVCNVPGYATEAVAQHAIALMLALCNSARLFDAQVRAGRWTQNPGGCEWDYPVVGVTGKVFGVLGTGAIGCAAAKMAQGLGMRVIGSSRTVRKSFVGEYVPQDELLRRSDVLSLHCAASEQTTGLIDRVAIEKMKHSAILINTARGAIVNTPDLVNALNSGRIYAAGLDVADGEPLKSGDLLLSAKNCIVTPHIGWTPLSAREELMRLSSENLKAFLNGTPIHRVDLEGA
jgi:glycerate dehydrogenase